MSRRWVLDASPIILLGQIGRLDLLPSAADQITIPTAVAEELRRGEEDDPARIWLDEEDSPAIVSPSSIPPEVAAWDLGRGETQVLAYSKAQPGWTVVLDDGAARRCASALDIPVLGTLGVLIVAKEAGTIRRIRPLAEALVRSGLHIDEAVFNHALRLAGES